jgi:hypothetical protein
MDKAFFYLWRSYIVFSVVLFWLEIGNGLNGGWEKQNYIHAMVYVVWFYVGFLICAGRYFTSGSTDFSKF